MPNLNDIFIDLNILSISTRDDYEKRLWASYPDYIKEFNRLLALAKDLGLNIDIDEVTQVPAGEIAAFGRVGEGTVAERAKLRELVNKSDRLAARVRLTIKPISTENSDIEKICNGFHSVARQLRSRRKERPTLDVEDEYDVQDLFHSLLFLYFDDIRPEEWTPSYAGGSAR